MSQNVAVRVVGWFNWLLTNRMSASDQAELSKRCDEVRESMRDLSRDCVDMNEVRTLSVDEFEDTTDGLCGLLALLDVLTIICLMAALASKLLAPDKWCFLMFVTAGMVAMLGRANSYTAFPLNFSSHVELQRELRRECFKHKLLQSAIVQQYAFARLENDTLAMLAQRRVTIVNLLVLVGLLLLLV